MTQRRSQRPTGPTGQRSMRRWRADEDRVLRQEVQKHLKGISAHRPIAWSVIAKLIPGRSNKDCRKRWYKIDNRWSRGPWEPDEEDRLRYACLLHETAYVIRDSPSKTLFWLESSQLREKNRRLSRWVAISEYVKTRSPDQCAKHWQNALDPSLSKKDWDDDEDMRLLQAVAIHGHSWARIRQDFPTRSKLALSNRLSSIFRKHRVKPNKMEQEHVPVTHEGSPSRNPSDIQPHSNISARTFSYGFQQNHIGRSLDAINHTPTVNEHVVPNGVVQENMFNLNWDFIPWVSMNEYDASTSLWASQQADYSPTDYMSSPDGTLSNDSFELQSPQSIDFMNLSPAQAVQHIEHIFWSIT